MMTIEETAAFLQGLDEILLLTHVRPDGDTVGSAAALCQALRDLGKTAYLLPNPELTATYAPYAAPYLAPEGWEPRSAVTVDIADAHLLPENALPYADSIALAIDHHSSHRPFAPRVCLDGEAAAAGEVVYEIVRLLTPVTPRIALPLYVAISTDTGCFVYSNTTAATHRIAAALLEVLDAAQVAAVNKALFRTKSKTRLAMESRMIAGMTLHDGGRVAVMEIPLSLCRELHATEADVEDLASLVSLVEGVDCGITLRELRPGVVKISVRSGFRINASDVCARLGGGGHRGAAGATVEGTLPEVKDAILAAVAAEEA